MVLDQSTIYPRTSFGNLELQIRESNVDLPCFLELGNENLKSVARHSLPGKIDKLLFYKCH